MTELGFLYFDLGNVLLHFDHERVLALAGDLDRCVCLRHAFLWEAHVDDRSQNLGNLADLACVVCSTKASVSSAFSRSVAALQRRLRYRESRR